MFAHGASFHLRSWDGVHLYKTDQSHMAVSMRTRPSRTKVDPLFQYPVVNPPRDGGMNLGNQYPIDNELIL
jgi:hypothetical protein